MTITFQQLYEKTVVRTHPSGLPENLVEAYKTILGDALTTIERFVEYYQEGNTHLYPYCSTTWNCKMTVVAAPQGIIRRLYTVRESDYCDRIDYQQATYERVLCEAKAARLIGIPAEQPNLPGMPKPFLYPDPGVDRPTGRAPFGLWAIHRDRIYVTPYLHSSEMLVVEYDGVKRKWLAADLVPDDDTLHRAVRMYAKKEIARDYEMDMTAYQAGTIEWTDALRDVYFDARERLRVRRTLVCPPVKCLCGQTSPIEVFDTELDKVVFANIGDFGRPSNGTAEADVANLVNSWSPNYIVTNGDNHYGSPADYPGKVGAFYGSYITDNLDTNRFWPALGNHDYNDAGLDAYLAYFTLPGNGRYYEIVKGPIHWFILNGEPQEPDGRDVDSKQAEWLRVKLAMSSAIWKFVVTQNAPYTSGEDAPGFSILRWPFKDWGADVVFSGDSHFYERIDVDGFPYITNGAGGTILDAEPGTVLPESQKLVSAYGAIKGTVDCKTATIEFWDISGSLRDTLVLTK